MPKYSMPMSTQPPRLRLTARRHATSRPQPMAGRYHGTLMSMARHIEGSLQMDRHEAHTCCAVSRVSAAPSLEMIAAVTSRGRSTQSGPRGGCSGVVPAFLFFISSFVFTILCVLAGRKRGPGVSESGFGSARASEGREKAGRN